MSVIHSSSCSGRLSPNGMMSVWSAKREQLREKISSTNNSAYAPA